MLHSAIITNIRLKWVKSETFRTFVTATQKVRIFSKILKKIVILKLEKCIENFFLTFNLTKSHIDIERIAIFVTRWCFKNLLNIQYFSPYLIFWDKILQKFVNLLITKVNVDENNAL